MEEEEVMVKEMKTERYSVKVIENGYVHLYGNAPQRLRDAVNEIDNAIPRPSPSMAIACLREFFKGKV